MFAVLYADRLHRLGRQACADSAGALAVAQTRHWIMGSLAGLIEPSLNGGSAELDIVASDGMTPAFGGQRGDEFAQLPWFRRCCQQGANDCKAQACPTIPHGQIVKFSHALSKDAAHRAAIQERRDYKRSPRG